jgi:hypothetical protein
MPRYNLSRNLYDADGRPIPQGEACINLYDVARKALVSDWTPVPNVPLSGEAKAQRFALWLKMGKALPNNLHLTPEEVVLLKGCANALNTLPYGQLLEALDLECPPELTAVPNPGP